MNSNVISQNGSFWTITIDFRRLALLGLVVIATSSWVIATADEPIIPAKSAVPGENQKNEPVKELVEKMLAPNFETSLEMKENTDFLLTPAFLVQAAISDQVVITYPAE